MIITVSKIGTGKSSEDPIRPDTDMPWKKIEERETEFVIEVFE